MIEIELNFEEITRDPSVRQSIGQIGFGFGYLGALGSGRFAQRHELFIGVVRHRRVARLLGSARFAEKAAEAVGVGVEDRAVFGQRRPRLVELRAADQRAARAPGGLRRG